MNLKKIPKWAWVTGGVSLLLLALLLYEHHQNSTEEVPPIGGDPCDPNSPDYDPVACPPTPINAGPVGNVGGSGIGAGSGVSYYVPLPSGSPAPEVVAENSPSEGPPPGSEAPPNESAGKETTTPGQPVVGSTPQEGLYGAIPAPVGQPHSNGGPAVAPAIIPPTYNTQARNEITRLQSEVARLRGDAQNLTAMIQAHPSAKDRHDWEVRRNQDYAAVDHKVSEIQRWQNQL